MKMILPQSDIVKFEHGITQISLPSILSPSINASLWNLFSQFLPARFDFL